MNKKGHSNKNNPNYKHGMKGTKFYNVWANMKSRCSNKNHPFYKDYGGRGIIVCKRWLTFNNFYLDMFESFKCNSSWHSARNTTLDRINNNKGYSPDNCEWATIKKQNNNTRANTIIKYNGKSLNIKQWSKELDIKYTTLFNRVFYSDMPIEKAFKKVSYRGKRRK